MPEALDLSGYVKVKFASESARLSKGGKGMSSQQFYEELEKKADRPQDIIFQTQVHEQNPQRQILSEKQLQASEKHCRSLISNMGNGFTLKEIIFDKKGKPCDCRFLKVNPAFERITGVNASDLVGKKVGDVFPGTEAFWVDQCAQAALIEAPIQFENNAKIFERYFEIIAYSPEKGRVATVFTDITGKIETEKRLHESEKNFRAIADNANDGILITNREGAFVYANRRASAMTGYSNDALMIRGFIDLIHSDQRNRIDRIFKRSLADKSVPPNFETALVKESGGIVPIEVTGSKTVWREKTAIMIIIRDISLRKRLEEALGKINYELEQRVNKRTNELMEIAEKLEDKQRELLRHKLDLERANKELVQTNTALSVLARSIDKKRDDLEKRIAQTISAQIIPVIDELQRDKLPPRSLMKLEVLTAYLNDLTPQAAKGHDVIIALSAMELRIAMMIKNGFSSEEIARLLHISPHTVKTHRRSIRKKVNIKNSNINLESYLKLKLGKTNDNNG
jgi:PAS domain S-box-containing protein